MIADFFVILGFSIFVGLLAGMLFKRAPRAHNTAQAIRMVQKEFLSEYTPVETVIPKELVTEKSALAASLKKNGET